MHRRINSCNNSNPSQHLVPILLPPVGLSASFYGKDSAMSKLIQRFINASTGYRTICPFTQTP